MFEALGQMFTDFVRDYGIMATTVFLLFGLIYRQQSNTARLIADQKDERAAERRSHKIEMAQRDSHIDKLFIALMENSKNTSGIKDGFDSFKDEIIKKADGIATASSQDRRNVQISLDENTESVNNMKDELVRLADVTEAVQKAIEEIVKSGVVLSEESHQSIVDRVVSSLSEKITGCIQEAIKTATQETPVIPPDANEPPLGKAETKAETKIEKGES